MSPNQASSSKPDTLTVREPVRTENNKFYLFALVFSINESGALPVAMSNPYIGDRLLIFTSVFASIQVFFVALRLLTRIQFPKAWGWDDVVILIALAGQLGIAGATIGYVQRTGIGYHQEYLNENYPEKVIVGLRYLFAIQVLYNFFFNVPKFAILLLYNRIFPPPLRINTLVRVMMVFLILQTIANTLAEFLICDSHFTNFDNYVRTTCISRQTFYVWGTFPNIISDVIILVLPMTMILRMHMETRMKIGLVVTFLLGSLGLTTSILRFAYFYQEVSMTDYSWNAINLMIITQAETGTYLICSCLPTYRRFFLNCSFRGKNHAHITTFYEYNNCNSASTPQKQPTSQRADSPTSNGRLQYMNDTYLLTFVPSKETQDHSYASSSLNFRRSSSRLREMHSNTPTGQYFHHEHN
ncbi:integral membrane protein [Talaromyces stipitatus ATCC 10500]|uniref:Integral membrane protein n=1 Tax=Talaromyces stipitatus (strain ATCC 10500 / CBS 375.48 / QM 6759 / NRRL 1006) TaxID=441959 RepID=B8M3R9_TALSN|nr:uncharacterized protein TSTA_038670 [Talaromyces stipitatus ATCC 10500]EED20662.1 integral membrane protein [Talaromyces stipitatus ATCC 10500]